MSAAEYVHDPLSSPFGDPVHEPAGTQPETLCDLFLATVRRHPGRTALADGVGSLTYAELADAAAGVAARLDAAGIGVGDRVGVQVASGSRHLYVAILGTLLAGAAYVPVDAEDPLERRDHVFGTARVSGVLTDGRDEPLRLEVAPTHAGRDGFGPRPGAGDDAWVIFTSGSTGAPKGVAVSHRSATAFVRAEQDLLRVGPDDRVLAGLSVAFDASCEEMWLAWANGATLVAAPRSVVRSGLDVGRFLAEQGVTVVSTVPSLATLWTEDDLRSVRMLVLGGEACSDELGARLARGREVWNTYGPTEATVVTTAVRLVPGAPVTIGSPLPGWEVAVVDEHGLPVPDGQDGELVIGGVGLARYLDPALDAERFAPLPALGGGRAYRTGDVVRRTGAGLHFVGRRDDQVKIAGRRLELLEVTARLRAAAGVQDAASVVQRTPAGDPVLVGYVVGPDADLTRVRDEVVRHLPSGVVPLLVRLEALPLTTAGKVDRTGLPWPVAADGTVPGAAAGPDRVPADLAGLADAWERHLGVRPTEADADFFELGGTSLAAAKLVSELRADHPALAVADLYGHRSLRSLGDHLATLEGGRTEIAAHRSDRLGAVRHLGALGALLVLQSVPLALVVGALDDLVRPGGVPTVPLWLLLALGAVLLTPVGRIGVVALARRVLLRDLVDGRVARRSSLGVRVWLVDRIGEAMGMDTYGGTPWAARVARLIGLDVHPTAGLGTIPSAASLVSIGAGATVEPDADVTGWVVVAGELVVGRVVVEDGARVGTRTMVTPGARIGAGAEVEAGSLVSADVPAGRRFSGSPARDLGPAGTGWPAHAQGVPLGVRALFAVSLTGRSVLSLLPMIPAVLVILAVGRTWIDGAWPAALDWGVLMGITVGAVLVEAVVAALGVRLLRRWITPGWHAPGLTTWACWASEQLISPMRTGLFPVWSSTFTRPLLRLMGVRVGRGTEVSTAIGLGPLVGFDEGCFVADDVVFNAGRAHHGWLHLAPTRVGDRVFFGNGALVSGGTTLGDGSLVGVQSTPPAEVEGGTSWMGFPALEFPRKADCTDPSRTTAPPGRVRLARAGMDTVRLLLPICTASALGVAAICTLLGAQRLFGSWWAVALLGAPVLVAEGLAAVLVTALVKWTLVGRYRAGEHPFFSWFVWRDEIVNSCQELLAGALLIDTALGTPLMALYLRLMGTRVGRDTWIDTLTISEFDVVSIGDGCAVNRRSCVESHLFHDRLMRIGPIRMEHSVTLGPSAALLPDTVVGAGVSIAGRSVVLRGEHLPTGTAWHGTPVVAAPGA